MEHNTGYIITEQNAQLLANITGKDLRVIQANIGWAAVYDEKPHPIWYLLPKNAALDIKDFKWVDSDLNGLPARSQKAIREEWAQVNKDYAEKLEELKKELNRAILRDG
jgi:hypothetical protein